MRLGAIFIAVCMVLIAASTGAVVYLGFGYNGTESLAAGIVTLTALGLYNTISTRLNLRKVVGAQLTDLSRANSDLARQVAEIGRRLAAVEGKVENAADKTRAATDPLAVEMGELGTLVKQLADTVASHDSKLAEVGSGRAAMASTGAGLLPMAPFDLTVPGEAPSAAPAEASAIPAPTKQAVQDEMLATIRSGIEANRIDLYLQPIVTLPQRKVRYYEAMSRLRTAKGDVLQAVDFIAAAEAGGLMPKIDNLVVFRCVQVVRRLLLKNREIGLFCNVSAATLTDPSVFQQLLEFLDANRAIAPSLVLEFTQSAVRNTGPMENESLAALAERGFRFSMDNVTDLRIEPRELATRGFRFIKIPANLLLHRSESTASDIHPADISDLVSRFGIDLVAEKIESEGAVVDLLDYDVRFGQGFLFSPPRPVRAEALQGIADRSDVVARPAAGEPTLGGSVRSPDGDAKPSPENKRASGLAQIARRV